MPVGTPHGPVHEENGFWYDTQEKALLYEVNIEPRQGYAEADHTRSYERGHLSGRDRSFHWHHQPHGISFANAVIAESRRKANLANIELAIRLWCQIEKNEQPTTSSFREPRLLPVPKALALFLAEKQAEMYKEESLTQALTLLQTYLTAKAISQCPSPT